MKASMTYPMHPRYGSRISDIITSEEIQQTVQPRNRRGHIISTTAYAPLSPVDNVHHDQDHYCYEKQSVHSGHRPLYYRHVLSGLVTKVNMHNPHIHWKPKRYELRKGLVTNWRAIIRYRDMAMSAVVLVLMTMFSLVAMYAIPSKISIDNSANPQKRPAFMSEQNNEPQGVLSSSIQQTEPQRLPWNTAVNTSGNSSMRNSARSAGLPTVEQSSVSSSTESTGISSGPDPSSGSNQPTDEGTTNPVVDTPVVTVPTPEIPIDPTTPVEPPIETPISDPIVDIDIPILGSEVTISL